MAIYKLRIKISNLQGLGENPMEKKKKKEQQFVNT